MRILNGWKEIAECLHLASRTAQRWERLGLPVRRVSNSSRSPTIAFSDEIEHWARTKGQEAGCIRLVRGQCASLPGHASRDAKISRRTKNGKDGTQKAA